MLIEKMTSEEARVLGTLLEKSLATPDYYPMTLNALRTACNQKSSRDPVTDYDDATVNAALAGLKRKCLVVFIPYGSQGNQFKYRHFLEDVRFNLRKPELAVLAVLLLRGAQTLNEVRTRAGSLHALSGLEEAEQTLRNLADRDEPLAELLPRRPGWKEPRWRDTLREHVSEPQIAEEAEAMESLAVEALVEEEVSLGHVGKGAGPEAMPASAPAASLRDEVESLKRQLAELREAHEALQKTVEDMRADLY